MTGAAPAAGVRAGAEPRARRGRLLFLAGVAYVNVCLALAPGIVVAVLVAIFGVEEMLRVAAIILFLLFRYGVLALAVLYVVAVVMTFPLTLTISARTLWLKARSRRQETP